jgi:hypothetical protein
MIARRLPLSIKISPSPPQVTTPMAAAVLGQDFTDSGQSVLELLNRVGADGWELADRQERQERGNGPSYWDPNRDPNRTVTTYTFKNLVPG